MNVSVAAAILCQGFLAKMGREKSQEMKEKKMVKNKEYKLRKAVTKERVENEWENFGGEGAVGGEDGEMEGEDGEEMEGEDGEEVEEVDMGDIDDMEDMEAEKSTEAKTGEEVEVEEEVRDPWTMKMEGDAPKVVEVKVEAVVEDTVKVEEPVEEKAEKKEDTPSN